MNASSSCAEPRSTASAPAPASCASSIGRLESRILPGASGPDSTSSSPVESTPTRARGIRAARGGRRCVASTPMRAAVEHRRRARTPRRRPRGRRRRGARAAGLDLQGHEDAVVAVARGALDHHDRVGTVGHRRAGHDPDRLARSDRDGRRVPGGELADHPEPHRVLLGWHRGVGGPHRVAVHRGVRERRHRLGRADPLGEHEPERVGAGRPRPARGGAPRRGPRPATSASGLSRQRGRARARAEVVAPARGRGRAGRARARCWPGGSRASGRCRSGRA